LLIVAACPGGRFAPDVTRKMGGDVALATTQIFIMTKLAPFTAPLTVSGLLGLHQLRVPTLPMVLSGLLLQTLPLYVGRLVAGRRPDVADRLERPLAWMVAIATVAVLAVFLNRSGLASLELLGDRGWLAVAAVVAAALVLGWLLGGSRSESRRATVAGTTCSSPCLASGSWFHTRSAAHFSS
jgi:predicted Na+-dependent transporter